MRKDALYASGDLVLSRTGYVGVVKEVVGGKNALETVGECKETFYVYLVIWTIGSKNGFRFKEQFRYETTLRREC